MRDINHLQDCHGGEAHHSCCSPSKGRIYYIHLGKSLVFFDSTPICFLTFSEESIMNPSFSRAGSGVETATLTMTVWGTWCVATTTATTPSAGSAITRTVVSTHSQLHWGDKGDLLQIFFS